ncbi:ATP-grasp fold amidoligase family protein [Luteibacter sp.]|uniref:ATP-grasp fold amidoligase family protein n=1 Tax=Luteibacter sp. TaxID=1886636 RepID=UPI003F81F9D2
MSAKFTKRSLVQRLPSWSFIDATVHFASFLRQHRRLPRRESQLVNDVIYRLKASGELQDPLRVFVTDKELLKVYVRDTLGDTFNVPTTRILRHVSEVSDDVFPERCVIKPTHASGEVIVRRDGEPLDLARIRRWFQLNYYRRSREPNYRYLQPKVIVEPLVFDADDLIDYKIFCVDGSPRLIQVDANRHVRHCRRFFDLDWQPLHFGLVYERGTIDVARPDNLSAMLDTAARLSRGFSLIRVDLYSNGEQVLVGELTNCPSGANGIFYPADGEATASRIILGDVVRNAVRPQVSLTGPVAIDTLDLGDLVRDD